MIGSFIVVQSLQRSFEKDSPPKSIIDRERSWGSHLYFFHRYFNSLELKYSLLYRMYRPNGNSESLGSSKTLMFKGAIFKRQDQNSEAITKNNLIIRISFSYHIN